MDEIIPDKRRLIGLIEQAHRGKLCLPIFQRSFVWPRDDVADLVRSIVRRYFIGSLLLLRCDPQNPPFAPEFLAGAEPEKVKAEPELLVLDGQQRLTSLMYALTAPDMRLKDSSQRRWFFIDLNLMLHEPDNDEIVFDRSRRELDGLNKVENQWERKVLPCTRLLRPESFLEWRDGLDDWLRDFDLDGHKQFRSEWRGRWTEIVNGFQNFEVPLVELPRVSDSDTDAIGRVCAIFEKLNSRGIDLSVYDLLVARLYRTGIDLHDLWKKACAQHKNLREWSGGKAETNKFGVLVLRTLALMRGLDPKPRILINLSPGQFVEDWERATQAIERALQIAQLVGPDGFGVFDKKWMPGLSLVPILAALRAEIEDRKLGDGPRDDLRRWYWCNVFLERYSSAVESKSRKDYAEFLKYWTGQGPSPAIFAEAKARIGSAGYTIRESATTASSIYRGVFCLLALRGARDWRRGEDIRLQNLEDHHIFPRKYLRDRQITKQVLQNTVVNRTLISDETNKKISGAAPADYVLSDEIFPAERPPVLAPHFIDEPALEQMEKSSEDLSSEEASAIYLAFLSAREASILAEVRAACGIDKVDEDGGGEGDWTEGPGSSSSRRADGPSEYVRTLEIDKLLALAPDESRKNLLTNLLDVVASWPGCYVRVGESESEEKRRIRVHRRGSDWGAFLLIRPSLGRVLFRLDATKAQGREDVEVRTSTTAGPYQIRITVEDDVDLDTSFELAKLAHRQAAE
jgi:hypothetical protein